MDVKIDPEELKKIAEALRPFWRTDMSKQPFLQELALVVVASVAVGSVFILGEILMRTLHVKSKTRVFTVMPPAPGPGPGPGPAPAGEPEPR